MDGEDDEVELVLWAEVLGDVLERILYLLDLEFPHHDLALLHTFAALCAALDVLIWAEVDLVVLYFHELLLGLLL